MRPEDVASFQAATESALGSSADIEQFVTTSLKELGAVISPGRATRIDLAEAPSAVLPHLDLRSDRPTIKVRFDPPARDGEVLLTRSHPLVAGLANYVLSSALDSTAKHSIASRAGAIRTSAVSSRTTLILSRFRFHLTTTREGVDSQLLAEQAAVHAFAGAPSSPTWIDKAHALELLSSDPSGNITPRQATDFLTEVTTNVEHWMPWIEESLQEAGDELLHEHRTAREAAAATGRYRIEGLTPIDVLGLYVLLPDIK